VTDTKLHDETVEHLKLIQGVINRMAQVSFILKGWAVTVVIAGLAFAANASNFWLGLLALFPSVIFWVLDAYYLRQERLFRCLYEKVRLNSNGTAIPSFSMDTTHCKSEIASWCKTLWRPVLCWFYLVVVTLVIIVSIVIYLNKGG